MSAHDQREFERASVLTLSDGTIWRYYNISNLWECCTGPLHGRFASAPVRGDRSSLAETDALRAREVKHVSRLCTIMSLEQARADWHERGSRT